MGTTLSAVLASLGRELKKALGMLRTGADRYGSRRFGGSVLSQQRVYKPRDLCCGYVPCTEGWPRCHSPPTTKTPADYMMLPELPSKTHKHDFTEMPRFITDLEKRGKQTSKIK